MYKTLSIALTRPGLRIASALFMLVIIGFAVAENGVPLFQTGNGIWPELPFALLIVFAITPLNLYCETRKWSILMGAGHIPFSLALKQVLAGLCAGFVTPNRIGEFAGRLYKMPQHLIKKGATMALAGSAIQSSITLLFGLVAIFMFPLVPNSIKAWSASWELIFAVFLLLFICIVAIHLPVVRRRIYEAWRLLRTVNLSTLFHALKWGILRYLVFTAQFIFILKFFGCELSGKDCFFGVALLYFCQSIVPGAAFGELGVRETLSIAIFGAFMPGALMPAIVALIIWLANIVIPVVAASLIFGYARRFNA